MKPNFALSLSQEAIRLLHRTSSGWRLVGEVDVQANDLDEQLAVLRSTATGVEPGGVRCKLVIPDELIRYLTVQTPGASAQDRQAAALTALEGATPYAVDQLSCDIFEDGDATHIAAVAQETLAEAEAFAVAHRFHPLSFVAAPETGNFKAEPFFGETAEAKELLAAGDVLERDDKPVNAATPLQLMGPENPEEFPNENSSLDDILVDAEPDEEEPGFISRRTVPTFRTQTPASATPSGISGAASGEVPGFGEEAQSFAPGFPKKRDEDRSISARQVRSHSSSETEKMTVFGANAEAENNARMRRVAMVCAVVVIVPLGIAAFASGALTNGLSGIFDSRSSPPPSAQFAAPLQPELLQKSQTSDDGKVLPELASLSTSLSDEDSAVLEALRSPPLGDLAPTIEPTPEEMRAAYAVSGIWPVAPDVPNPSPLIDIDGLYVTSIDPINPDFDAVALPAPKSFHGDFSPLELASPAPAGTIFALDDRGMVIPSPEGALNPDGILIFAGAPPVRQPPNLLRIQDPGEDLAQRIYLAAFRPQGRPSNLIESNERATLSGLTRSELALLRPRLRPQSAQENAAASASLVKLDGNGSGAALIRQNDENDFDGATARAVAASLRPDARPNNFSAIVARTQRAQPAAVAPTVATASVAPRVVTPRIPSSASTSREATVRNAINLRRVNLIGVYGTPSSRRALVRLGNGRYRKVAVGDRIDGGKVSAIGDAELRYQKKGRAIVLKMPSS